MGKPRQPYAGFSTEEIFRAESNSFVIQIANDFYNKDGDFAFSKEEAERHYKNIIKNILLTLDEGTDRQRATAIKCLSKLIILPLRIH